MANNRLYLGNRETKKWIFVEKGWGSFWNGGKFNAKKIHAFIVYEGDGANVGEKTNLIFFNETDDIYDEFINKGEMFITEDYLDENNQLIIPE